MRILCKAYHVQPDGIEVTITFKANFDTEAKLKKFKRGIKALYRKIEPPIGG